MNTVYLQIYFITVSSVLGTGILGLPVTLYNSGFYPFLVIFILELFMEVLIIVIFVEILQKAHATQVEYDKEKQETPTNTENPQQNSSEKKSEIKSETKWETQSLNSETELLPLNHTWAKITCNGLEDQQEIKGPVLAHHDIPSEEKCMRSLDLYLLGEMFLCYGIRHVFNFLFIFDVVTVLIAYSLAGSEAYSEMLGINCIYVIPVFTWCLALLIVFAFNFIQPVVSILTFFTASLFTVVVIVTLSVSSKGEEDIQNDFNYIQDSFLLSTVTLGGSVLVMPLLFKKIENDASQIKKYRLTILMGLFTCTILNILWCWAVLEIVPQHCTPMVGTNQSSHSTVPCNSLESAKENGEISTDVLIKILQYKYPSLFWMSKVIEVFIMISITVSFLAFGIAMHHIICGIVESKIPNCFISKYAEGSFKIANIGKKFVSSFLSLIIFAIIFIIATWNPKGFLDVIEKFISSNLNSINILIFIMFLVTRYKENNKLKIPLPLPNMVMPFIFLLPLYFGFAIGYDIYFSIMSSLYHETDKSHLPELQLHLYHNSSLLNVTSPLHVNATS